MAHRLPFGSGVKLNPVHRFDRADRGARVRTGCAVAILLFSALATVASAARPARPSAERFALFARVAATVRGDTLVGAPEQHPLVTWVTRAVALDWLPGDTVTLATQADSTILRSWRLTLDSPRRTPRWLREAEQLATGYYVLGHHNDALEWLHLLDRIAPPGRIRAHVRHLLTHYYVTRTDTLGVARMARTLTPALARGRAARRAAEALLAGLFLTGQPVLAERTAARIPSLRPWSAWFAALRTAPRDPGAARDRLDAFLRAVAARPGHYDESLRLAALLLAADLDWRANMDSLAAREYGVLAGSGQPYARAWSRMMLGGIAMYADDYATARAHYAEVCRSFPGSMWHDLACSLEWHAGRMIQLHAEATP